MINPPRILIGDNGIEYGRIYKQYLSEDNFSVVLTENNGEQILSGIYALRPDVVIMNAALESSSADARTVLSVIRGMRKISGTEKPKVIVTAGDQRPREKLLSWGADDFLERPFQFCDLSRCVENQLPEEIQKQRQRAREQKKTKLDDFVTELLLDWGADPNKYGFQPMIDAIVLYVNGKSRMTKDVYPAMAKKYDRKPSAIEHEFRSLVGEICQNKHDPVLNRLLKPHRQSGRPISNGLFISVTAAYVRLEFFHEEDKQA